MGNVRKAEPILKTLFGLALLAAFLAYSRCATTGLVARKPKTPIVIFGVGQRIPRNSYLLGIAYSYGGSEGSVGTGDSLSDFGSCRNKENTMRAIKKEARAAGAEAISLFLSERDRDTGCYRIEAFLLDMVDIVNWPRIGFTEDEIKRSFDARKAELDEIEGIWESRARTETYLGERLIAQLEADLDRIARRGDMPAGLLKALTQPTPIPTVGICRYEQRLPEEQSSYRVAIVRTADDPRYPFAAYVLDPEIPEWQPGFFKAWLRKIPGSSGYEAMWYRSTFQSDRREFYPDDAGVWKARAVLIDLEVDFSIEQTLTRIYPPKTAKDSPD